VAFSVWLAAVGQLEPEDFPIDWNLLDDMFSQMRQFRHLKILKFWIFGEVDKLDVEVEIRQKLPKCAGLRILSFG
jgi:hypothetical protein